jgi:DNA polymerase III epsilon subunit-like protein
MSRLCFFHTDTNNLHQTNDDVSKKNLYCFARLVKLSYEIGHMMNGKFISEKKVEQIVKPRSMYISDESIVIHGITQKAAEEKGLDPEIIINQFKDDIKKVNFIISHSIDFHLKTLIAEALRYNIMIDYNKYIIIDTMSFHQSNEFVKLKVLNKKLLNNKGTNNINMIQNVFFKLYSNYSAKLN